MCIRLRPPLRKNRDFREAGIRHHPSLSGPLATLRLHFFAWYSRIHKPAPRASGNFKVWFVLGRMGASIFIGSRSRTAAGRRPLPRRPGAHRAGARPCRPVLAATGDGARRRRCATASAGDSDSVPSLGAVIADSGPLRSVPPSDSRENKGIMSQLDARAAQHKNQGAREKAPALAVSLPSDEELACLVEAWPTLPDATKAGIRAAINARKDG